MVLKILVELGVLRNKVTTAGPSLQVQVGIWGVSALRYGTQIFGGFG